MSRARAHVNHHYRLMYVHTTGSLKVVNVKFVCALFLLNALSRITGRAAASKRAKRRIHVQLRNKEV